MIRSGFSSAHRSSAAGRVTPMPGSITCSASVSPVLRFYQSPSSRRTDLSALSEQDVVLVVDDANLTISYREQSGRPLDYAKLLSAISRHARSVLVHVLVATITEDNYIRADSLARAGYHVWRIPRPNVDVSVGFVVGRLSALCGNQSPTWAIATGDGDLGLCVAGALYAIHARPRIVTVSVRHTTGDALCQCPLIARNLFLADDLSAASGQQDAQPNPRKVSNHV